MHSHLEVPEGDVLIHAGDFTNIGQPQDVKDFSDFLGKLPHKHKIVIAGNHDLSLDEGSFDETYLRFAPKFGEKCTVEYAQSLLTNCTYLKDTSVEVEGFVIYGSPWQPEFLGWAFNLPRGTELEAKWKMIPDQVDILVTHGPPIGHGDLCNGGGRAGCVDLLLAVQKRKPRYHVFGHIHEGYGITTDGQTIFVNASNCNAGYDKNNLNPPIVFDLPNKGN